MRQGHPAPHYVIHPGRLELARVCGWPLSLVRPHLGLVGLGGPLHPPTSTLPQVGAGEPEESVTTVRGLAGSPQLLPSGATKSPAVPRPARHSHSFPSEFLQAGIHV